MNYLSKFSFKLYLTILIAYCIYNITIIDSYHFNCVLYLQYYNNRFLMKSIKIYL